MKKLFFPLLMTTALTACTTPDIFNEEQNYKNPQLPQEKELQAKKSIFPDETTLSVDSGGRKVSHAIYRATDKLIGQAPYLKADTKPILITSFAKNTDGGDSAFGLMVSQQMGARLSQLGFPTINHLIRSGKQNKHFSQANLLANNQNSASAILFGEYAVGAQLVFVSTRLVRPADNRVLASYDFPIQLDPNTTKLLRTRR